MRIGTWNLAGRWSARHCDFLLEIDCDVWLFTEVSAEMDLPDFHRRVTTCTMTSGRFWAGVFARKPLVPLADPHPATAMATAGGTTYISSVLPWRASGSAEPWVGGNVTARTEAALTDLRPALDAGNVVWGGDWNHALEGVEYAGSQAGREAIIQTLADSHLTTVTASLPSASQGHASIDHIAVASHFRVASATHVRAQDDDGRLSDHDAYVVEVF